MQSKYFYWFQALIWLLVFVVITVSILLNRSLGDYEIYLAIALIGTTGLYSCITRHLYKKWVRGASLAKEVIYFTAQSFVGGSLGAFSMIALVLLF